jgi:hypothetical protein
MRLLFWPCSRQESLVAESCARWSKLQRPNSAVARDKSSAELLCLKKVIIVRLIETVSLSVCYACLLDDLKDPLHEWHAGLVHLAVTIGKQSDVVSFLLS